jgi:alanyl-tRNA synthetase
MGTIELLRRTENTLVEIANDAGVPPAQAVTGIRKRLADLKSLQSENKLLLQRLEHAAAHDLLTKADGKILVAQVDPTDAETLRRLATQVCKQGGLQAVVLGTVTPADKPAVVAAVSPDSTLDAGRILEPVAKAIGGGHGKQREVAVAGGRDVTKLRSALDEVKQYLSDGRLLHT